MKESVRINKYLSESGYCSRREADKLIEKKRVTINGKVPEMGAKIGPGDAVKVNGKLISQPVEKPVYIAFNKPIGIVCTTDTKVEKDNIIDYINYPKRIFPIGRLDKPSEGLIFLTNHGDMVNKILRARNNHEKEYIVTVNKPITKQFIHKMGNGVPILDTVTDKCVVEQISQFDFRIVLTQGLNRQIRRMCEHLSYDVRKLKRIRIMNIKLDVPLGRWRHLTDKEMAEINSLVADSTKTADDSFGDVPKSAPKKSSKPKAKSKVSFNSKSKGVPRDGKKAHSPKGAKTGSKRKGTSASGSRRKKR